MTGAVKAFLDKFNPPEFGKMMGVPLSQAALKRHQGVATAEEKTNYLSLPGNIIYFATSTYPELSYAASKMASFAVNPEPQYIKELQRV